MLRCGVGSHTSFNVRGCACARFCSALPLAGEGEKKEKPFRHRPKGFVTQGRYRLLIGQTLVPGSGIAHADHVDPIIPFLDCHEWLGPGPGVFEKCRLPG